MVIYRSLSAIELFSSSVLTIGTFDGVHLGHQTIFESVVENAKKKNVPSVVITFNPHPQHVTRASGQAKKQLLMTTETKIAKIEQSGIDYLLVIPFDQPFSKLSADDFLNQVIIQYFHPAKIIIGYDHHFGRNRQGNAEFLETQSRAFQFELCTIGPVEKDGQIISSSLIRNLICEGEVAAANALLGAAFSLKGRITRGLSRGKSLGYPTANLSLYTEDILIPCDGVYCVNATLDGSEYRGLCNIGYRPTFEDHRDKTIEVHLLAGNLPDLYEKEIEVRFHRFVRDEIKFSTVELLADQIHKDIKVCEKNN